MSVRISRFHLFPAALPLLALCGLGFAVAMSASAAAESVTFKSGAYADFRQLIAGEPAPAIDTVAGTLAFPDEKRDRYPALVIVHTIGGYQESNEGWHAARFREAGFATLTYVSPTAQRMADSPNGPPSGAPPWAAAVAEAYAALQLLARDPRIDQTRIGIVGFSFGGEVAHLSAFERFRAVLAPGDVRFAAHLAYYPAGVFGVEADRNAYTGAPLLMLLGEKDDNLPIPKAQEYLAYAKAADGARSLEVSFYPGAYHAWTVSSLGSPRFYPQYASTRKCPYVLLGPSQPTLLVEGRQKPVDPKVMRACLQEGRGYSMAYDAALRAKSTDDALAFLSKVLGR
jgi:dienelactone hydrolase